MQCVRTIVLSLAFALAASVQGATYTIPSTYDESTGQWVGDVVELTNVLSTIGTWQTVKLSKGVYDISMMTNAPMAGNATYGQNLLHLTTGTTFIGATGNRDDVVIKGPGRYRLLSHANGCTIKHITFVGGRAQDATVNAGGAIRGTGSAIDITNCAFLFKSAVHGGAAGQEANANSITSGDRYHDCYFYGNSTYGAGYGGAACGGSYYNCQFVSNACNYAYGLGGGVAHAKVVSGCQVVSNFCVYSGGGLASCAGVTNCTVSFNAAVGPNNARGGGLYNCGVITNCVVECNKASGWGHGMSDTGAFGTEMRFNGYSKDVKSCGFERCDFLCSFVTGASYLDSCRVHHASNSFSVADNVYYGPSKGGMTYVFTNLQRIRNTLIDHCWITNTANHAAFCNSDAQGLYAENCTIADNTFYYTLRGYSSSAAPAAFVNTVFARNKRGAAKNDLTGYSSSYVTLTNCVLGVNSLSQAAGLENCDTLVKGENWKPRFADEGEFPYEPKFNSALRGAGRLLDWMDESSLDLSGRGRTRDGKVDVGAYQCWMEPQYIGLILSVR